MPAAEKLLQLAGNVGERHVQISAAIIAIEMPAAMRPYSMAVAPLSLVRKGKTRFFIGEFPVL